MGIKTFRPVTSTQRFKVSPDFSEITKETPEKSLTHSLRKTGGRNNRGRITTRHIGGGHKQKYRIIDFKRDKFDVEATVIAVEYDPNRTARIALLEYPDKDRKYIIWPDKLNVGDKIVSASESQVDIKPGNCMRLKYMPLGTLVHNVEMVPTRGGILVRSAGSWAQVMAKDKGFAQLQMPSGEIRMVSEDCRATVGQVGFIEHSSCIAGKAGHSRWLGRKPTVRGAAMNPIDHPHGGGEGKAGQGNPHPVTPWGKPTKGGKTRKPQKLSNRFIIKRRTK